MFLFGMGFHLNRLFLCLVLIAGSLSTGAESLVLNNRNTTLEETTTLHQDMFETPKSSENGTELYTFKNDATVSDRKMDGSATSAPEEAIPLHQGIFETLIYSENGTDSYTSENDTTANDRKMDGSVTSTTTTPEEITTLHQDTFETLNASENGTDSYNSENTTATNTRKKISDFLRVISISLFFKLVTSWPLTWTRDWTKYLEAKLLILVGSSAFLSLIYLLVEFHTGENMILLKQSTLTYFGILMELMWTCLMSCNFFYPVMPMPTKREFSIRKNAVLMKNPWLLVLGFLGIEVAITSLIAVNVKIFQLRFGYNYYELDGSKVAMDYLAVVPGIIGIACIVIFLLSYPHVKGPANTSLSAPNRAAVILPRALTSARYTPYLSGPSRERPPGRLTGRYAVHFRSLIGESILFGNKARVEIGSPTLVGNQTRGEIGSPSFAEIRRGAISVPRHLPEIRHGMISVYQHMPAIEIGPISVHRHLPVIQRIQTISLTSISTC